MKTGSSRRFKRYPTGPQPVGEFQVSFPLLRTRKSNPFHGFFSWLITVCLQSVPALNISPLKNFTAFQLNNFHCYLYACGWNLPLNFPYLRAPLPICWLPLKIPFTWGSPASEPGAVLDLCPTGKPNFCLQLKPLSDPFSHSLIWRGLQSNFRVWMDE